MKVLLVDNFDSFTHNIYQQLLVEGSPHGIEVHVQRNHLHPQSQEWSAIVISPGPGSPLAAGISSSLIRAAYRHIPILGICLGHQVIAHTFGAEVSRAAEPMHGKISLINHSGEGLFLSLPNPLSAARYHSLVITPHTLPSEFAVDAWSPSGEIMAVRHRCYPLFGVQFHPESFMTQSGNRLMKNFISIVQQHDQIHSSAFNFAA